MFVIDTMNFSFWPKEETQQCEVTYKGTTYTGYMTLCAAIARAMEEGEFVKFFWLNESYNSILIMFKITRIVLLSQSAKLKRFIIK